MNNRPSYINAGGRLLSLDIPRIMGVINITPDSFYAGSRAVTDEDILGKAASMLSDGADILDIGGFSSRPYAREVPHDEEKNRVLHAIKLISSRFPAAIISIDTFRADIAYQAVNECGAHIINDISGGEADKDMFSVVSDLNVPYIMMHMQGEPSTMQKNPVYDDVVPDILRWFGNKIAVLRAAGVKDIIIDPGIGFGKTIRHNFEIFRKLCDFKAAGLPILVGVSRKSMIWKTLGLTPGEALNGTSALNAFALMGGADILRVHDVREAREVVRLFLHLTGNVSD